MTLAIIPPNVITISLAINNADMSNHLCFVKTKNAAVDSTTALPLCTAPPVP
jgi:hypothetical protein